MKKFITLVIASIMVVMAATAVYAAETVAHWEFRGEQNETWFYVDKNGDPVTCKFQKSGDKFYYLGDDGAMVKNAVVDYNDNFYFVGEDGAMVDSAWVFTKIYDDDEAAHWMYFTANGKAHKNGWKEISGNKYHFTDGKMDYGFLDADGKMIDEDAEEAFKTATYYCGTEDDGAMKKNTWFKVEGANTDKGYVWLYFNNAGKKLNDCVKEINGKKYGFDKEGAMVMEWAQATAATASGTNYYDENSGLLKKKWFFGLKGEDSEEGWYYFDGKGVNYAGVVKKIDNNYYAFDAKGKMLTGFVQIDDDMNVLTGGVPADVVKKSDVQAYTGKYMYFSEVDDATLGAAIKGKTTIEISDGKMKVNFSNSKGIAEANGFKNVNGYAYFNSVLQHADEDHKYTKLTDVSTGDEYLLTQAGKICKKGTYKDTLNNVKWVVDANGAITGPTAY